ncbi:MAG: SIR2 family protein [Verrucomicrobia bacterium]|nr:SIR2 family protein [Verrucomicrobiota bacterium]
MGTNPEAASRVCRIPGKTVYILGSGFSYPIGLPVMSEFIPEGLRLLKEFAWERQQDSFRNQGKPPFPEHEKPLGQEDRNRLEKLVSDVLDILQRYKPTLASLGLSQPNMEDLFCAVDLLRLEQHEAAEPTEPAETPRAILQQFVAYVCHFGLRRHLARLEKLKHGVGNEEYVLAVPHVHFRSWARPNTQSTNTAGKPVGQEQLNVCAYEAFLSQVITEADEICAPQGLKEFRPDYATPAIISLNYDCVIENKAARFGDKLKLFYGQDVVEPGSPTPPWLCSSNPSTTDAVLLPLIKMHGSANWQKSNKTDNKVTVLSNDTTPPTLPPLILPTWQRGPFENTVFSALLHEALAHLRRASRLVFIGYSMPPTDRYFRYLLAGALNTPEFPAIEICNIWGEEEARRHLEAMLGRPGAEAKLKIYSGGLEDYVRARRETHVLES